MQHYFSEFSLYFLIPDTLLMYAKIPWKPLKVSHQQDKQPPASRTLPVLYPADNSLIPLSPNTASYKTLAEK